MKCKLEFCLGTGMLLMETVWSLIVKTPKKCRRQNYACNISKNIDCITLKNQRLDGNTVDPDEMAHYEPSRLDLQCLRIQLLLCLALYGFIVCMLFLFILRGASLKNLIWAGNCYGSYIYQMSRNISWSKRSLVHCFV